MLGTGHTRDRARGSSLPVLALQAALLACPFLGTQARSASAEQADSTLPARASSAVLEEVIVTALKRDRNGQDVPMSIQAISADMVRQLSAKTIEDLRRSVPSFNIVGPGSLVRMGMRGVVDYPRNIGIDPRMGVYIDGVFQGRTTAASQPLFGLESIEMLRGPQGTLFGRNTVSGAINMVTRKASPDFSGEFTAGVGNEDQWTWSGYLNGPISDRVFGYLGISQRHVGGYDDNEPRNSTEGDLDQDIARAQLRWLPTDALEVIVAGDYGTYDNMDHLSNFALPPFEQIKQPGHDEQDFWGTALTLNYTLGDDYTLTSISAYRDEEFESRIDDDWQPLDGFWIEANESTDHFSQEIRLVSPLRDRYDWVLGLYYFDSDLSTDSYVEVYPQWLEAVAGVPLFVAEAVAGETVLPSEQNSSSYAAYAHGNYRLTDTSAERSTGTIFRPRCLLEW
jgi:iron complex outermembrane receptor protein